MSTRYVVGPIPSEAAQFFQDIGIKEGDVLVAPEGFPEGVEDYQIAPVELRRRLHPNVAWFVSDVGGPKGFLRRLKDVEEVPHA